jgi:hypothetical protein
MMLPADADRLLATLRTGAWPDAQVFPPLVYAVPGLIPEGSVLLVGAPKIGKSWLVLAIGLAASDGGKALGIDIPKRPAEVSDSLRTRAALGGRVKAGPLLGELPQELAEDGSSLLPKLVLACGALRTGEREHQPRTQVEQTDDEVGWTRPARVDLELGDVVDCPLSVLLQPQGQALDGDSGASACRVGLIHGVRICR